MAVELHQPPTPRPPPPSPAAQQPAARPRTSTAVTDWRTPSLVAIAFGLIAALLVHGQGLAWNHAAAVILIVGLAGAGLTRAFDRAFMARRAAVAGGLAAATIGGAKLLRLDLELPGIGHLRWDPSLGWPEAILAAAALLLLGTLAVLERRG